MKDFSAVTCANHDSTLNTPFNGKKNAEMALPAKYPNNRSCSDVETSPLPTNTALRPLKV